MQEKLWHEFDRGTSIVYGTAGVFNGKIVAGAKQDAVLQLTSNACRPRVGESEHMSVFVRAFERQHNTTQK